MYSGGTSVNGHLYLTSTSEQLTNSFVPIYSMMKDDISIQRTPFYKLQWTITWVQQVPVIWRFHCMREKATITE